VQTVLHPFEKVSVNGKISSVSDPVVPASDQGLMYGYGVFDTLRVRKSEPFMLDRHIERLLSAALTLYMNVKGIESELCRWVSEFISELSAGDCVVRITLTKGSNDTPWVIITARPFVYTHKQYDTGFRACVSSIKRNAHSPLAKIKSLNYLDNILAKRFAHENGFDEALMLNGEKKLCECSMSNLFFVRNKKIFTPMLDCGVLNGITRAVVIEVVLPAFQLPLCEEKFTIDDLTNADEAFLTNSVMGIMPLVSVDGYAIGKGKPGNITETIRNRYESLLNGKI